MHGIKAFAKAQPVPRVRFSNPWRYGEAMKNVQVIDDAINCSYSIYSMSDEDFSLFFPLPNQDVEFIEDVVKRLGKRKAGELVLRATATRVEKPKIRGLHGTVFFGLAREKRRFYPNKREQDMDAPLSAFPRKTRNR